MLLQCIKNLLELEEIICIHGNTSDVSRNVPKGKLHGKVLLPFKTIFQPTVNEMESSIDDRVTSNDLEDGNNIVRVEHMSASWSQDQDVPVLNDINFEVHQHARLLSIIGPVGAGKVSKSKKASIESDS